MPRTAMLLIEIPSLAVLRKHGNCVYDTSQAKIYTYRGRQWDVQGKRVALILYECEHHSEK